MKLPELPTALHEVWCSVDSCYEYWGWEDADDLHKSTIAQAKTHRYIYTEDQLKAYGEACYRKAIEDAAQVCESQSVGWSVNPRIDGCGGAIAANNCGVFIQELLK